MAFFTAAAIGISGLLGAGASIYASSRQTQAADQGLNLQQQMYQQSQRNYQPYLNVGQGATYTLGHLMGIGQDGSTGNATPDYSSFYNSPDYQFAQQQGELGIERGANARGMNLSGGTLRDLASFNSGLATQQYGNYFNRLMGLSQLGQASAAGSAANTASTANSMSGLIQGAGQAQASGAVGVANAANSTVGNGLMYNYLNRSAYGNGGGGTPLAQQQYWNAGQTGPV